MKIPKQIQIIGRTVNVELDKNLKKREKSDGLACLVEDKIKLAPISAVTTKQDQDIIFIHECLHFYEEAFGWKFKEKTVQQIAEAFYQIYRQVKG